MSSSSLQDRELLLRGLGVWASDHFSRDITDHVDSQGAQQPPSYSRIQGSFRNGKLNHNSPRRVPGADHTDHRIEEIPRLQERCNAQAHICSLVVFTCQGAAFPIHHCLLKPYAFFQTLVKLLPNAPCIALPGIDRTAFALLAEVLLSRRLFAGHETHLNLPRLVVALQLAIRWSLSAEVGLLQSSIWGYLWRRVLASNPHRRPRPRPGAPATTTTTAAAVRHEMQALRAEELYRTWCLLLCGCPRTQRIVSAFEMVVLFVLVVPRRLWCDFFLSDVDRRFERAVTGVAAASSSSSSVTPAGGAAAAAAVHAGAFDNARVVYIHALAMSSAGYATLPPRPLLSLTALLDVQVPPDHYVSPHDPSDPDVTTSWPGAEEGWEEDARWFSKHPANNLTKGAHAHS
ncbi:hypothetical protein JDV02_005479 [Purpureocillium takamizusanense]|uniref:Uncharacterized protein n=1 Tax=Purpureocillium takamizusanense TaxID=2060973 RepID=A0A9Q8QGL4_9HYPO|nr:uncharacterized protein JDV02_005479 [Purpureocillium takamizusanense]UNI19285.1 hypothetical protein JDV02_005479 [Purpureocillium takamizusanense]